MRYCFIILLIIVVNSLFAQQDFANNPYNEDSLKSILETTPPDTNRVKILIMLSESYFFKHPETSLYYSNQVLDLSVKLQYSWGIQNGLFRGGESKRLMGDFIGAVKMQFEGLEFNQHQRDKFWEANSLGSIGLNYFELQDYPQSVEYLKKALTIQKELQPQSTGILFSIYTANSYIRSGHYDSAIYYQKEAEQKIITREKTGPQLKILFAISRGDLYFRMQQTDSAYAYYWWALALALANKEYTPSHICMVTAKLSTMAEMNNQTDSSLYYARFSYNLAQEKNLKARILESSQLLSQILRKNNQLDSAFYYNDIATLMNDSIYGKTKFSELQLLVLQEQRRNQLIQQEKERLQSRIIVISLSAISAVILITGMVLYRNNRSKHKANLALERTLKELNSTQAQLIQQEKMASLGELTAGIAHEIQNPLNFVNNFSDVNKELIDELQTEIANGNLQLATEIADDIQENETKINHHGKRAEAIVKGMLQHSRSSTGTKEPTDINKLADEYLRLAYHGLRAKDKSFNAEFKTAFDDTIGAIQIVPQDIGRVLLNLYNNAFYAVADRSKSEGAGFVPMVTVSTRKVNGKIEIKVADNGTGIPAKIKEKIFQPFFTTKPTGQGTGLGLSLSYDTIKAHGGEIMVETTEGTGTEFIVQLPFV